MQNWITVQGESLGAYDVAEGLKRVALYIFNRADADGLPKELVEDVGRGS
jgi:hypothetical protein